MTATAPRRSGRYSPNTGFVLPAEGFTGTPGIGCPDSVGDEARAWWETWATSQYAHVFTQVEWQSLAVSAVLMDRFYAGGSAGLASEVRQREAALFGVSTRSRLHIEIAAEPEETVPPRGERRRDPRLRSA